MIHGGITQGSGEIKHLMSELRKMLDSSDLMAEEILGHLCSMMPESPELSGLKQNVEMLDFAKASEFLISLAEKNGVAI